MKKIFFSSKSFISLNSCELNISKQEWNFKENIILKSGNFYFLCTYLVYIDKKKINVIQKKNFSNWEDRFKTFDQLESSLKVFELRSFSRVKQILRVSRIFLFDSNKEFLKNDFLGPNSFFYLYEINFFYKCNKKVKTFELCIFHFDKQANNSRLLSFWLNLKHVNNFSQQTLITKNSRYCLISKKVYFFGWLMKMRKGKSENYFLLM